MFESLKELYTYRSMIKQLSKKEIRGKYKGSTLGFLWSIILPIIQVAIYVLVFGVVANQSGQIPDYPIYVLSGMVIWTWFSESMNTAAPTMILNKDLIKKIYFPRVVLPIVAVISKFVNFLIMLCLTLIVMVFGFNSHFSWWMLLLPLAVIITFMFFLGIAMIISVLNPYIRDIEYIVNAFMLMIIWVTPVMYDINKVGGGGLHDVLAFIIQINPMTYFVGMYRDLIYETGGPEWSTIGICIALSIGLLVIGYAIFRHFEKDIAEMV